MTTSTKGTPIRLALGAWLLATALSACVEEPEKEAPIILIDGVLTPPEDCVVGQLCDPTTWETTCDTAEKIDCSQILDSYTERTLRPYICSCAETRPDIWSLRCDPAC